MDVGSLFSGIGGFELGLERAGMRTVWLCERDPYCQRVLAKHWPEVPCYDDVCALVADAGSAGDGAQPGGVRGDEAEDGAQVGKFTGSGSAARPVSVPVPPVDVLCGGFPCQDLSYAGRGDGIEGRRSGLWGEFARLIGELRPRYVVIENVPALATRGLDRVLADLAACGFDAEWDHLPASAFGAPHFRDRLWLVAYTPGPGRDGARAARPEEAAGAGPLHQPARSGWWAAEPDVGRVANGVPNRMDRLTALGNSLVPQVAEWIGQRIVSYEERNA